MILPTKYLSHERALISVGGDILSQLYEPRSVSELWDKISKANELRHSGQRVTFDWFILALTLLYTICAVRYEAGLVYAEQEHA